MYTPSSRVKNRFMVAMTNELFLSLLGYDNSVVIRGADSDFRRGTLSFYMEDPSGKYHPTAVPEAFHAPEVVPPIWGV